MPILLWIILSTLSIGFIAWIGLATLIFKESLLKKIILPLVAMSAGTLLAGAVLHLIPEVIISSGPQLKYFVFILVGFSTFLILEQFIHWHHCHKTTSEHSEHKKPVTYLILVADTVHNFIDGLTIGSAFVADLHLGFVTWFAVAAHEVPQELGDFGVLIHGGWKKMQALIYNFISALSVVLGGVTAYFLAASIRVEFLLSFAAGSFIYIACSDLIPEVKHHEKITQNIIHFLSFSFGVGVILVLKFLD